MNSRVSCGCHTNGSNLLITEIGGSERISRQSGTSPSSLSLTFKRKHPVPLTVSFCTATVRPSGWKGPELDATSINDLVFWDFPVPSDSRQREWTQAVSFKNAAKALSLAVQGSDRTWKKKWKTKEDYLAKSGLPSWSAILSSSFTKLTSSKGSVRFLHNIGLYWSPVIKNIGNS